MIAWRRGLTVAIILLLLAVGTTVYLRLDVARLERQAMAAISQTTGGRIRAEKASFSLLHTTLRLQGVRMESPANSWTFSADEIQVDMKLWPLLLGETRMDTVYMISPTLDLTALPALPALPILTRLLPDAHMERLIVRQGTVSLMGVPYAEQTELDIRRTSPGDNTLVELRTNIDKGAISLTGHAERSASGTGQMSGKIEMDHVPIARLLGRPSPLAGYDEIGTALTYNISDTMAWQLFGDITLGHGGEKSPGITLRGKLTGSGRKAFAWKEGFIKIGDEATITTNGAYTRKNGCTIHAKTDHLPLNVAGTIAGIKGLSGDARGSATLNFHNGVWLADAKSTLKKLHWSGIDFPELQVTWSGIRHQQGRTDIASADITQPGKQGEIKLAAVESAHPDWQFSATATNVDGWWTDMANALLALHDKKPRFQGSGRLSAHINASRRQDSETALFEIHADGAEIDYGKQFTKPKGVAAAISGNLESGPDGEQLTLSTVQLADSSLHQLQWQRRGDRQSLGVMQASIDFSALHSHGIHLPNGFDNWRGSLSGNLGNHTFSERPKRERWLDDLDATLQLQSFGRTGNSWSGALRIRNGVLESSHMLWQGGDKQHATVSGSLNLADHKGNLNLRDVAFDWQQQQALPAWFADASIHGRILADRLSWAGNDWRKLKAAYRLNGNRLILNRFSAMLAGGSVGSKHLMLTLAPDAVHFSGPVRMGLVQLQKLSGLDTILGTTPGGYLYMNARLEGTLPFKSLAAWHGSGDIEIQRGGWHGGNFTLSLLKDGSGKRKAYRFSRASSHFHIATDGIALSDLQVESGDIIADGDAHIAANGALAGKIRIKGLKKRQGIMHGELGGVWPHVTIAHP